MSPSSRRAWIEIVKIPEKGIEVFVALLAEGVDRNILPQLLITANWTVALLAEGVDRNFSGLAAAQQLVAVALLAEGVDRNLRGLVLFGLILVALLAEGVDRNTDIDWLGVGKNVSPSSRRAWIEMCRWSTCPMITCGRPPRGRRKMPPAGVSTLAISFSCTTVDRYPLWQ